MKTGLFRIFQLAALICCCARALFPQAGPPQGKDESKDAVSYLRSVVVEKGKTVLAPDRYHLPSSPSSPPGSLRPRLRNRP